MTQQKERTAADLALYLGCEVETPAGKGRISTIAIEPFANIGVIVGVFSTWFVAREIKPLLRPLSDMTEQEGLEFARICVGKSALRITEIEAIVPHWRSWKIEFENSVVDVLICNEKGETWFRSYFQNKQERQCWGNTVGQHEQTRYLLSRHFDLFGWIEAGLALDKTKI